MKIKGLFTANILAAFALLTIATPLSAQQTKQQHNPLTKQYVDSAPYSSNRVKRNSKKMSVLKDRTKVRLKANLPRGLGIANSDVRWTITPKSGKGRNHKRGREVIMRLKPGQYRVNLTIGAYKASKSVTVSKNRNAIQTIPIKANVGIVKASSNFTNVSSKDVKWVLKDRKGKVVSRSTGKRLRTIVAAGSYKVSASYKGRNKTKPVTVGKGRVGKATITMPTGKVMLRAYKGKSTNQPLMQKVKWSILDSKGKKVSGSSRNNFRVSLFPGKYKAVIKTGGKTKTKPFTVKSGKTRKVTIHL